jgi:hypothetical protein
VLLLPVVVVVVCGEMWLIRVMECLLPVVVMVVCGELWLIRVNGVFAVCGGDGCVW